jgi:dTDP-4-dehydrorhamnose 3,5-epimerase
MPFIETGFPGLFVFEPVVYKDSRGFFFEAFNQATFATQGVNEVFVQDNQSKSSYGVVRGLHYQLPPYAQSKLVRVLEGSILDVVLDIRKGSPTYGKVYSIELTADNQLQLYIPKGFAHGFSVLSPVAQVLYKCDTLYNKPSEGGVHLADPSLAIDWQIPEADRIISEKDTCQPLFKDCVNTFVF